MCDLSAAVRSHKWAAGGRFVGGDGCLQDVCMRAARENVCAVRDVLSSALACEPKAYAFACYWARARFPHETKHAFCGETTTSVCYYSL